MKNPTAFALLIGVGDYRIFDPSGDADLKGPPNDVAAWLRMVYDLGIPRAQIRICASPGLPRGIDPAALEGVRVTGASRAEIVDGLEALARALDGSGGTKAVLTYSGHGTRTAAGQVLCPADIRAEGDTLVGGLTVDEVGRILDRRAPGTRLTAFVDTCHDVTGFEDSLGTARGRGLSWPGLAKLSERHAQPTGHRVFGDLVLTSSQPGTVSYDMPVIGGVRGAFSWAASNVIRRYGLVDGVAGQTSGLTFHALAETCGRILEGMVVKQTPRFVGPPEAGDTRVFSAYGDDVGVSAPQALPGHEVWPGLKGKVLKSKLYDLAGNRLGTLYITDEDAPTGWTDNRQYWVWDKDATKHGWAKQTFIAKAPSTTNDAAPSKYVWTYETSALSAKTEEQELHGWSYIVRLDAGGDQLGYLRKHSNHLTIYSTQNPAPDYLSPNRQALEFEYYEGDIKATTYAVARDYAK